VWKARAPKARAPTRGCRHSSKHTVLYHNLNTLTQTQTLTLTQILTLIQTLFLTLTLTLTLTLALPRMGLWYGFAHGCVEQSKPWEQGKPWEHRRACCTMPTAVHRPGTPYP